jgi:hypothetical protein
MSMLMSLLRAVACCKTLASQPSFPACASCTYRCQSDGLAAPVTVTPTHTPLLWVRKNAVDAAATETHLHKERLEVSGCAVCRVQPCEAQACKKPGQMRHVWWCMDGRDSQSTWLRGGVALMRRRLGAWELPAVS